MGKGNNLRIFAWTWWFLVELMVTQFIRNFDVSCLFLHYELLAFGEAPFNKRDGYILFYKTQSIIDFGISDLNY